MFSVQRFFVFLESQFRGRFFLIVKHFPAMPPQNSNTSENSDMSVPSGVLSDEEIRSRAAAYAQRIYEQQLEAYEAQRTQALAMLRAREEFIRRQAEYEEACRAYYARQQEEAGAPAVLVDAETGEQVYTQTPEFQEKEVNPTVGNAEEPVAQVVLDEFTEEAAFPPPETETLAENPDSGSADFFETEIETLSPEENFEPSDKSVVFSEETSPEEEEMEAALPKEARFPTFAVLIAIVCVSGLSEIGYILFSGDPRFELQREHFLSVIGLKKEKKSDSGNAKSAKKIEIPDFGAHMPEKKNPESEPEVLPLPAEEIPESEFEANSETEDVSVTESSDAEPEDETAGAEPEDEDFFDDDEIFDD